MKLLILLVNAMRKGRPQKIRFVQKIPHIRQFSPRGKPGRPDEVELRIDQLEALKLADLQGYTQDQAARLMKLSRPTFGRVLRQARKIVADALVNGKVIHIRTADVQVGVHHQDVAHEDFDSFINELNKRMLQKSSDKICQDQTNQKNQAA